MTLREPTEDERFEYKLTGRWIRVAVEGEQPVGFAIANVIEGEAWINDVRYYGSDRHGVARLLLAARKQIREWGFGTFRVNVSNLKLVDVLLRRGFVFEQMVLRSRS